REYPVGFAAKENRIGVQQKGGDGSVLVRPAAQRQRGFAGFFRPVAAGEVGQGQQWFPNVGGAVVEAVGNFGSRVGNGIAILGDDGSADKIVLQGRQTLPSRRREGADVFGLGLFRAYW